MSQYPNPYVTYLVEFHATRDYFECHELLEEYWKENPNDGLGHIWVGLIQLAVGLYHERRGNLRGAMKMYDQSFSRLNEAELSLLGINGQHLISELENRRKNVNHLTDQYVDVNMILIDEELRELCEKQCDERNVAWGTPSDRENEAIIHRHTLRDRSEVIATREESLRKKRKNGVE
ncbi:DUF309 domain-containing protein [Paenibacillus sp. GSMTC-2017]|uniref:DUF309 domain-containing protein n=1 Tax=Paenibacillus sp. GSMTC-2017 TaxID=2794350 RepID=UPI0018D8FC23|nr:DUF309 domain-containing protein [Paenibacillus sp. GSMTC-2017]MBH5317815.1 DUF309 domain-containing protein [Paenibacillus sp. GSMTC-2017]